MSQSEQFLSTLEAKWVKEIKEEKAIDFSQAADRGDNKIKHQGNRMMVTKKKQIACFDYSCTKHNANTWRKVQCNQSGNERSGEESANLNNRHILDNISTGSVHIKDDKNRLTTGRINT